MKCSVCPRNCKTERDIKPGFCSVGEKIKVARAAPHFWEEPCLSGEKGSGTVFFSGCNLGCVFCQNRAISRGGCGEIMSEGELEGTIFSLIEQGASCIEFVTPTHYTAKLASLLCRIKGDIPVPVVWNRADFRKLIENVRK
jgi:putative pyruvate formate lyase activating enzyme